MTAVGRGLAFAARDPIVVAIIAVLAVVVVWFTSCRPKPNVIPPRENRTIDSLDATRPVFDSSVTNNVRVESVYVAQSSGNARQARQALHVADSLHAVAILWQRAADAQEDTASRWFQVARVRGVENDSLRSSNRGLDSALVQSTHAQQAADRRASIDSARLVATTSLNDRLAKDVLTAGQCRIALVVSCPTRTATALTFTLVGVVLKTAYDRRKP